MSANPSQQHIARNDLDCNADLTANESLDTSKQDRHSTMEMTNGDIVAGNRYILLSSAHDCATIENNIVALAGVVSCCSTVDLAYTLAVKRNFFHQRAFVIVPETLTCSALERVHWTVGVQKDVCPTLAFAFTGGLTLTIYPHKQTDSRICNRSRCPVATDGF